MGQRTINEVRDWLGDPRGGPGRVGGPTGRSGTGLRTYGEVRDELGDPWEGLGQVGGPSGRSGTGWWTPRVPERVGGP